MSYSLVLIHRYEDYPVGVPLSHSMLSANEKSEEYLRFWNMILRYMGISQPLPDILMLEESRHLDPTTIAYDKKHNRQPRYWRDMSEEQFKTTIEDLWDKQSDMPPTGKGINIFKN
ncbi:hypothetical protein [Psychromonas algicola]|uniref:hypothetical protein n=1 Tax=Psychromonas algicola TaxID=2555642 RepID=UPI001ABAC29B|nr:hypothetical protein [Psychromonas sp. RZ5]